MHAAPNRRRRPGAERPDQTHTADLAEAGGGMRPAMFTPNVWTQPGQPGVTSKVAVTSGTFSAPRPRAARTAERRRRIRGWAMATEQADLVDHHVRGPVGGEG